MVRKSTAVWLTAALLLTAAWFLWPRPQPQAPPPAQQPKTWQAQLPTLQLMDPKGDLEWFLTAEKIQYSQDGKAATIVRLNAKLQADGEEIVVEAPKAQVDWEKRNLTFTGPVKVKSKELSFKADRLQWQAQTRQLSGEGGIEVTTKTSKFVGERLTWQQPQGKLVVEGGVKLWATSGTGQ